ncbi:MFS transporter [Lentzea sp. NEAU-D7]|uniref:MFS transporter n=1 Tax=Lentzea sp. NEAU-D7 TaxID=2994667 RepID=UPI00224B69AA|nr:MFS transporter [Lentzea sp. NEAU-D7]MCX2951519.1 MFS transporter [Lentzea sp. NEAU-D7]
MTASSSTSSKSRPALGLAVVCAAHFLIGADGLAVAIALPDLQQGLAAEAIDAQWVLSAYGLAFGGALLLGGRLGDLYGRRRLLVHGMLVFACGSLLAGAAQALWLLIAARALQGLGAAAAVPAALALISSMYPPGPARTRALSLLAAMATVGIMSGLLLGGVITDLLGWRWLFLLMTVPALISAAVAPRVLPEARDGRPAVRLDFGGAVLVSAGLMAVLFGLTGVEHGGVASVRTLVPLVLGVVVLVLFVLWERRTPAPLIRFGILRVRSLRAASLAVGADALAFTSVVYVGTLFLRNAQGYGALQAGLALLPVDVVALVVSCFGARILARWSPRAVLSGTTVLIVIALLWLARAPVPANYLIDLMAPLAVLGAALPAAFIVATHEAVADVALDEKGLASGIFETANHLLGGAIGVAVYATVLAASGYRAAFLTAAFLVVLFGLGAVFQARGKTSSSARVRIGDRSEDR